MEERKLIKFGKSAFCMTIPHTWLKKNKIQKGDSLTIQETLRNSLEIMPVNPDIKKNQVHELSIDITEKSTDEIIQLLLSTYLNGYTHITLRGVNLGKVAFIRKHISEFIAAEIMEVTSDKIIINIFWDIQSIDLNSIIVRIGHINNAIFSETIALINSKRSREEIKRDAADIKEKEFEVQRQVLLARRAIKYALNNSSAAFKFRLSSLDLLYVSYIIYFFGMIGNYILKIAEIIGDLKIRAYQTNSTEEIQKKELKILLQRTADYYRKVFDTYKQHKKLVKFVFSEYTHLESSIYRFRKKNPQAGAVSLLAEYISMLISKIKETEFTMISMENAPK